MPVNVYAVYVSNYLSELQLNVILFIVLCITGRSLWKENNSYLEHVRRTNTGPTLNQFFKIIVLSLYVAPLAMYFLFHYVL